MKIWEHFKRKCALSYLESIIPLDKTKKEKYKWKVEVRGEHIDDLISPPERIPFEKTEHIATQKEAESYGKMQWKNGCEVEIWKLVKRWK